MPTNHHHPAAHHRNLALDRPRRVAWWVTGLATAAAAAIAGVVGHQLPGAASAPASGSTSSAGTAGSTGSTGSAGSYGTTSGTGSSVAPTGQVPTVTTGGSTIR